MRRRSYEHHAELGHETGQYIDGHIYTIGDKVYRCENGVLNLIKILNK
jgi:hypothetical protein